MKKLEYFTESSSIIITDHKPAEYYEKCFAVCLADNSKTLKVIFDAESKASLAKFLREASDELERTKPKLS